MKKVFVTRLIGLLALFVSMSASAYDLIESGGIHYYIIDGEATVACYPYSGDMVIPSEVTYKGKTYPVTKIAAGDRYDRYEGLTSLVIPNSVTTIGYEAFGPNALKSLVIGSGVKSIGGYAFRCCTDLKIVISKIEKPFEIDNTVFLLLPSDAELIVPNGTKAAYQSTPGWNAFSKITEVKDAIFEVGGIWYQVGVNNSVFVSKWEMDYKGGIVIPERVISNGKTYNVTGINLLAFYGCSGLTSVTIPNSVTSIGYSAFSGCSGLTSVTIPNSVTSIDDRAFRDCSGLTSVTIPNSVTSIGYSAFSGCSGLTSVTISNSVTSIGSGAFFGCSGLTSVTIPNGVTSIGNSVFSGCSGLTSVTIPNSVTSINDYAFSGCNRLVSVNISDLAAWCNIEFGYDGCNPLEYAHHLYINGNEITHLVIPNSVTSIRSRAFSGCSGLTSVTIPKSVTSINNNAFSGCSGLTSVTIPNSVTSIGSSAFSGCSGLTSIKVESGNQEYDSRNNCNAIIETSSNTLITGCKTTAIPNSVTSIGSSAFYNCSSLTSITIPNSVTSIDSYAFSGCSGLTSVTIPNSVTSIGGSVFSGCTGLKTIVSEIEKPFKIYSWIFSDDIYNNVELIVPKGTKAAYQAMEGWNKFAKITEAADVSTFTENGIYYKLKSDGTLEVTGLATLTTIADIPSSITVNGTKYRVTSIGDYAFSHCGDLTSVTIPNVVISIGNNSFYKCYGLTSVAIPNSVTSIGDEAFFYCRGLTSVIIGNSVTSIGNKTFEGCSNLTSVIIGNSVTKIGIGAFADCNVLAFIVSEIEYPFEIDRYTFDSDTYNVAELIVPYGTKAAYQATKGWNRFTKITEAADKDEALFSIDGITYEGTKSAKSVVVKAVETKQMSIEIPASVSNDGTTYQVTGVADDAFKGCNMGALIWNVEAALPNNAFSNASIGSNFLLYVKSADYAPSSVKNVVVNGTAQTIVLSDNGGQFYCPQTFIARSISYTHNYTMETGGNGKGWEALALPFFVQKINHSTRGEIVPFALYSSSSSQKPFWLAKYSGSGFKRTSAIEANEPYIIAMPNNSKYRNEYNLAGEVIFSAENAAVPKTPDFDGKFLPAFAPIAKSDAIMALNNSTYPHGYDAGSHFVKNLRDIHPFEAYMTGSSSTRGVIEINIDDGTTDIDDIMFFTDDSQEVTIHTLSGQQKSRTTQRDFDKTWNRLPKGLYIVNGKKMIK